MQFRPPLVNKELHPNLNCEGEFMDILSEISRIRRSVSEIENEPTREAFNSIAKALDEIQRAVDRFDKEKREVRP